MKKNILIIAFVLLVAALVGFSNETKSGFVRKAPLYDTVKKKIPSTFRFDKKIRLIQWPIL